MRFLRRLCLLAVLAVGAAVLAGPAFGARPAFTEFPYTIAPPFTSTLVTPHFVVHYQSDIVLFRTSAITQTTAGDIAAYAEREYNTALADGYPAPVSDLGAAGGDGGDARTDIYVMNLLSTGPIALTGSDGGGTTASAYIELNSFFPELAYTPHVVANEVFNVIELGIWQPSAPPAPTPPPVVSTQSSDYWLLVGAAEWMAYRSTGYDTSFNQGLEPGPPDMSLDCRDPFGTSMCDFTDAYTNEGYSRWPFFEYVAEKYGAAFIRDVLTRGAAASPAMSATDALSAALIAKGTTLTDTYNAWTEADLIGGYGVSALQGLTPSVYGAWQTGAKGGNLGTVLIPVNHLSTRTIKFTRGDGDSVHTCYEATLSLTVGMPAGTLSRPVFWWNAAGNPPVPLTINGNTATASLPWDTCTYVGTNGFLALPNASNGSTEVDGADFSVKATLSVDTTKPTIPTPTAPPDPVGTQTPVIPVTSADVAPTLFLFGPEILRLTGKDTQLRLIVESNGQGSVQAKLGSIVLGTVSLRGGNNDLRFKLPSGVLRALRRTASAPNVLTLTPKSPNGTTIGQAVTRTVRMLAPKVKQHRKK
jgi:hypothetical protein